MELGQYALLMVSFGRYQRRQSSRHGHVGRLIGWRVEHSILRRELHLRTKLADNILKFIDMFLERGYLILHLLELSALD